MQFSRLPSIAAVGLVVGCTDSATSGFSLECDIPTDKFFDGRVGRGGIPALLNPLLVPAANASFMDDTMRVLGMEQNGTARAYPLFILWWHEVVNDILGEEPVLVTYCPLTGSGLGFDPAIGAARRLFGISGLLLENNLVMFDAQNESLWNQMLLGSQCGPDRGASLARLPLIETTWGEWRSMYPVTTVLDTLTGYERPYGDYPYGDYAEPDNPVTLFPSSPWSAARPPKELVLGIRVDEAAMAYPFGALAQRGAAVALNDAVGGRPVLVMYADEHRAARAFDRRVEGQVLTFSVWDSSAFLLTDSETQTRWNARGQAIEGELAGSELELLPDAWTVFWFTWSINYPGTDLLE